MSRPADLRDRLCAFLTGRIKSQINRGKLNREAVARQCLAAAAKGR